VGPVDEFLITASPRLLIEVACVIMGTGAGAVTLSAFWEELTTAMGRRMPVTARAVEIIGLPFTLCGMMLLAYAANGLVGNRG
jgi:hypothetical protein